MKTRIINKRYRLIEKIGEGGMGNVYLAEDTLIGNRQVALKNIKKELINLTTLKSFKKEFDAMTRLKHPNLAWVYDFGLDKEEDNYYITMEYVNGITLKDLLKQQSKISEEQILNIMIALCRTLEFIHSRKILHRDIKPSNIMLANDRQYIVDNWSEESLPNTQHLKPNTYIKVLDFGLADLEQADKTEKNIAKGTLFYIAPEVLRGKIDHRADIYSAGVTFYELITSNTLYNEQSSQNIISILRNRENFNKNISLALEKIENPNIRKIIKKMITYKAKDRYKSSSEIILAINKNLKRDYIIETKQTREAYVLGAGFVDREKELARLIEKLELIENQQEMLSVIGQIGIGKSRLYQEFKKYCQLNNIIFLEGNCLEKISKTYSPFLSILNEVLLNVEEDLIQTYGAELKKILPYHNRLKKIKVNPSYDPKTERDILVQNITNFLLEYTNKQKTRIVIYLNDLHWADEGTLEILQELMYKLSQKENKESNIRVYTSIREEEIENIKFILEKLKEKNRLEEIILMPFDDKNVENYIYSTFGEDYIDNSLKQAIITIGKKVGGNPFFLQELIKSLVENNFIIKQKFNWKLTQSIDKIEIPNNLKTIISIRLDRLDLNIEEKKSLQILSLLNKKISIEDFKQIISEEIEIDINKFFIYLEREEVLISDEIEKQIEYRFIHTLTKELIEEEIPSSSAKKLHQYIAERLEYIYKDNIEEQLENLAYHYNQTEIKEKAIYYLEKAADKAKESYENEKAMNYYNQLLIRLGKENKEKRIESLLKKGAIFDLIGKWNEGIKVCQDALNLAEEIDNKLLIAKSKSNLGKFLQNKGDYKNAFKLFKEAIEIFTALNNDIGISCVIGNMGIIYTNQCNYLKAIKCYEKLLKMAEELGDKYNIGIATNNIGNVYFYQGNYEKAMKFYKKNLHIAKELGNKRSIGVAIGNIGIIYMKQGNYEKAMEYYERKLKIAEELSNKYSIALAIGNIGSVCIEQGNYQKAMEYYQKELKISEELDDKYSISIALINMGYIYIKLKKYTKAEEYYNRAIHLGKELQLKFHLSGYLYEKAELYFILKRFEEAKKLSEEAINIAKEIKRNDILFNANLLYIKIEFYQSDKPSDKAIVISKLKTMFSKTEDEEQIATFNYELYKMTGEKQYSQQALKLYQQLYKRIPSIEYKERIEELVKITKITEETEKTEKTEKNSDLVLKLNEARQNISFVEQKIRELGLSSITSKTKIQIDKLGYFQELLKIIRELNSNLTLKNLLEKIVDVSINFINADKGILMLYNQERKLEMQVARNNKKENLKQDEYKISNTILKKVIETGKPLFISDITEVEEFAIADSIIDMKIQSVICLPLGKRLFQNSNTERRKYFFPTTNQLMGILYVYSQHITEESRFTSDNIELLQVLSDQASVAIIHTILYEKNNIDTLTQLYLRPYFEECLKNELSLARELDSFLSLIMIDIDSFKAINDNYGHQKGNEVLKELGSILTQTLRTSDICARYGRDQFVIILPNTDIQQAKVVIEKLREEIKNHSFPCGNITISIGISTFPEHIKNIDPFLQTDKLLKYADQALYYAKENGHDHYEIWNENILAKQKPRSTVSDILTGDSIRDYHNVEMLLETLKAIESAFDLKKLLNQIVNTILNITEAERCIIMMLDEKQMLKISNAKNHKGKELKKDISYSKSICDKVLKNGIPICIKGIEKDIATTSQLELDLKSIMCVPLQVKNNRFGVIYVDSQYIMHEFTEIELSFFSAIASQLALVIENTCSHETKEKLLKKEIVELQNRLIVRRISLGKSEVMKKVFDLIDKVAKTNTTVLIYGETGTGKELTAHSIHNISYRKKKPFRIVDCSSISAELLESELFGYEKGAYTGAHEQKKGLFESADGGTVFLDEINELPLRLQSKLLRVLQEKNIRRIGGRERIDVDIRLIAASNKKLEELIKDDKFREDLYYRLNVFTITLPPLRKRGYDIILLAHHFLAFFGKNKKIKGFTKEAEELMKKYTWQGNIRELEHKIERAVIISNAEYISVEDLELEGQIEKEEILYKEKELSDDSILLTKDDILRAETDSDEGILPIITRKIIKLVLEHTKDDVKKASKILGISRASIYRKLKDEK